MGIPRLSSRYQKVKCYNAICQNMSIKIFNSKAARDPITLK